MVSKGAWPYWNLDFGLLASNSQTASFGCFKPPALWYFVIEAWETNTVPLPRLSKRHCFSGRNFDKIRQAGKQIHAHQTMSKTTSSHTLLVSQYLFLDPCLSSSTTLTSARAGRVVSSALSRSPSQARGRGIRPQVGNWPSAPESTDFPATISV